MNAKRLVRLSFQSYVITTVLLLSGCRTAHDNASSKPTAHNWQTIKAGVFNQTDFFYAQFGAVPFEIVANHDVPGQPGKKQPLQPGSLIQFRIYDADKNNIAFTFMMEKKSLSESSPDTNWLFSATGASGEKIDVDDSCLACHKQQAHNDYLFNTPFK